MFEISGISLTYIENGNWDVAKAQATKLDGELVFPSYIRHAWDSSVMTAAEWEIIEPFIGMLVNIKTVSFNDRKQFSTYVALMKNATATQNSLNMLNVTVEFLIKPL